MFGIDISGGEGTERAIDLIRSGAYRSNKSAMGKLIEAAKKQKPAGYDMHAAKARTMYGGEQIQYVKAALSKRYPSTWHKMTPVALNILRTIGELDAQAYREQPERWAIGEDGEPIEDATEQLEDAARGARLNVVLPELERRLGVCAGTHFVRLMPSEVDHGGGGVERKHCADLFWPDEVQVIADEDAPADLLACHALLARVSAPGDPVRWEMWSRPNKSTTWMIEIVDDEGKTLSVADSGMYVLPWVAFTDQLTQGTMWSTQNRDLTAFQDAVNVALTNHWFKDDMQGHKQVLISGPQPQKGRTLVGGPGALWDLPEGTSVQTIDADHDMTTLNGLEKSLRMLGMSLRQSPDAWATEPGPPLSGISRIVQNIAPNQKRDERTTLFKQIEESRLLPMLAAISDRYFGTDIGDAAFRVRFAPPPDYEEPMAKFNRAREEYKAGLISHALFGVRSGAYRTLEEAIAAGLSPVIGGEEPAQPEAEEPALMPDEAADAEAAE